MTTLPDLLFFLVFNLCVMVIAMKLSGILSRRKEAKTMRELEDAKAKIDQRLKEIQDSLNQKSVHIYQAIPVV
jgi:septation ring formation regulator EzrA